MTLENLLVFCSASFVIESTKQIEWIVPKARTFFAMLVNVTNMSPNRFGAPALVVFGDNFVTEHYSLLVW